MAWYQVSRGAVLALLVLCGLQPATAAQTDASAATAAPLAAHASVSEGHPSVSSIKGKGSSGTWTPSALVPRHRVHPRTLTGSSGADQPGFACSTSQPSTDNSSSYQGPPAQDIATYGSVWGDLHNYYGIADTGLLRADVWSSDNPSGHWIEAYVANAPAGFEWGLDRPDASMEYDYNIGGLKWDGSQWLYKHDLTRYDSISVQPGPSAWIAWYYDCSGVDHWYIGSSANQLTEVKSVLYGFPAPWNFGTNIHGAAGASVAVSNQTYSYGIPAKMEIMNWNLTGNTVYGPTYAPFDPYTLLGLSNPSTFSTTCNCVDPVNTATGNLAETFDELSISGRGIPLDLNLTYNALAARQTGPFGYGWTDSYAMNLTTDTNAITVHQENGSTVTFTCGSGGCSAPGWVLASLTQNGDGTYTFKRYKSQQSYVFSAPTNLVSGQLLKEVDRNGYTTSLTYNGNQLQTVADSAGRTFTFQYNSGSSLVSSVSDQAGRSVSFAYDGNGNLTDTTDARGQVRHFTYDTGHLLLTQEDPNQYALHGALATGPVTTNAYDPYGRVTQQTDPLGHVTTFSYAHSDDNTIVTTVTNPKQVASTYTYGGSLLTSKTVAVGTPQEATWTYDYDPVTRGVTGIHEPVPSGGAARIWQYTYDANGNITSATDPLGDTTTATYNSLDEPLTGTTACGSANGSSVAYCESGDSGLATSALAAKYTTTATYDANGNLLTVSHPVTGSSTNAQTTLTYGDSGHPGDVTQVTTALDATHSHKTDYAYDAAGDLTSIVDEVNQSSPTNYAQNPRTTFAYNTAGQRTSTVSPIGNDGTHSPSAYTTTYVPDALGNVTDVTDPLSDHSHIVYDADGNPISVQDPRGIVTGVQYDADNEPTLSTNADGTADGTLYDATGNVTEQDVYGQTGGVTNSSPSRSTTYSYNAAGELSSETDPAGKTTSYSYDLAGRLTSALDPMSRTTTLQYDNADRVCSVDWGSSPAACGTGSHTIGYTYDAEGNRLSMTDATGTTSDSYDSLDRLTSETTGAGTSVGYGYDLDTNLTSISYPGGIGSVTRTYSAIEQVASISDWLSHTTTFSYDLDGNLTATHLPPSGDTITSTYDAADQLLGTGLKDTSGLRVGYGSSRNADGNVATAIDGLPVLRHAYSYDSSNRLTSDIRPNHTSQSWTYDQADNLTSVADNGTGSTSTLTYGGNASNTYQLQSLVTTLNGSTTHNTSYGYNADGDRTSATDSITGTTTTTGYDQFDRLTSYTAGSTSATYAYNGDGLRTSKTVNGTTTQQTWDEAEGLPLLIQDGTTNEIDGPDGLPLEQVTSSGTVSYYVHDQLGSTMALVASGGQIASTYDYDAYGTLRSSTITSGIDTTFRYAGQDTDPESGLQYLQARYYDPSTSQFLTVDPLAAQTGQPYGYTAGNPLSAVDSSGLFCVGNTPIPLTGDTGPSCRLKEANIESGGLWAIATGPQPGATGCSVFPSSTPTGTPTPYSMPTITPVPPTTGIRIVAPTPIRVPIVQLGPTYTPTPAPTPTLTLSQRADQAHANSCAGPDVGQDTAMGGTEGAGGIRPANPPEDDMRQTPEFTSPESEWGNGAGALAWLACAVPPSVLFGK
jgi:RHS repeat-associated protein